MRKQKKRKLRSSPEEKTEFRDSPDEKRELRSSPDEKTEKEISGAIPMLAQTLRGKQWQYY